MQVRAARGPGHQLLSSVTFWFLACKEQLSEQVCERRRILVLRRARRNERNSQLVVHDSGQKAGLVVRQGMSSFINLDVYILVHKIPREYVLSGELYSSRNDIFLSVYNSISVSLRSMDGE